MEIATNFEPRLQRRYEELIAEHLRVAQETASGLRYVEENEKGRLA